MKTNINNTATLKAPKITAAERKQLEAHKRNLEEVIRDAESGSRKVRELRKKESSLEKEAASLHHAASQFNRDAEIKLAATLKQIERIHEAIQGAESHVHEEKQANVQIVDQAHELIAKICQATYQELLNQIGAVLAPYYSRDRFGDACFAARGTPAVNHLVRTLLGHGVNGADSIDRIFEAAKDTLRKIDALLKGSEIWRYDEGGEAKPALEPNSAA